ncbi:MAG TPA: protein kinase [Gemmataceae bacterium]|nr:protein kinase [Gemmataceae bacterium]
MPPAWLCCPHCRTGFQGAANAPPDRCPACGRPLGAPAADAVGWYYAHNKQRVGPVAFAQLRQLAAAGQLQPNDMVRRQDTPTWVPAVSVDGLFAPAKATVGAGGPAAGSLPPVSASPSQGTAGRGTTPEAQATASYVPHGTSAAPAPAPKLPASVADYEVLGELGRGGMGVVYKARHRKLNRIVALKMILSGEHAGAAELARFLTEARAVAQLQHPNVVQIYEIGEQDGRPFFALEFVDGDSLARKLGGTPLPPREAARLVETLAQAMQAAHERGIVHRDLKPANILLASGGRQPPGSSPSGGLRPPLADCTPKIADFGLARQMEDEGGQTRPGAIMGTPSYMAPEQASGQKAGPAADVYALGAILYECLTGRPPFRAATVLETLELVRSQDPVPPSSLQPRTPRDLETICLKCLEKDPGRRYASAKEMAEDVGRFLADRPILARPPGLPERAVKFARRNKLLVGFMASLLLGSVLLSGVGLRAWQNANRAQVNAEKAEENAYKALMRSADIALQRGQFSEAVAIYDDALGKKFAEPDKLRLQKARALFALNRPLKDVEDEIRPLIGRQDLGELEGPLLLLRGEMALGIDNARGKKLLEEALARHLEPDEKAYAQALSAETAARAVPLLEETLKHNAYHHGAHVMLGLVLSVLGRNDEVDRRMRAAVTLFPDDPNILILLSLSEARRGNQKEANRLIDRAGEQLPPDWVKTVRSLARVFHRVRNWTGMPDDAWSKESAAIMEELRPVLARVVQTPGQVADDRDLVARARMMHWPPFMERLIRGMADAWVGIMLTGKLDAAALDKARQTADEHPEGLTYFLLANLYFSRSDMARAEHYFVRAAETPAIAPIGRQAAFGAIMTEAGLAWGKKWDADAGPLPENQRPEMARKALLNLRRYPQFGRPTALEASYFYKVALNAGEPDLARQYLTEWYRESADVAALRKRVEVEWKLGCYFAALEVLKDWEQRAPDDPKLKEYRAETVKRLREAAGRLGR